MATLNFKGKAFVQNLHLGVQYHQLIPVPKKSVSDKPGLNDNLIIHGDNLKALKSLLPMYAGKVRCIYIDPPYNTGNEGWKYNDNVTSPMMKEWLGKVVDREDLTRHDKWLCMMMPRLKLLNELLDTEGVIFVSIDDIEVSRLRLLMDEIFGEERFLGQLVWQSRQNKDNRNTTGISIDHEYVLCYGNRLRGSERNIEQFSNPDNDPRGDWVSGNMVGLANEEARPNLHYDLVDPRTKIKYTKPKLGWRFDKARMRKLIEEGRILWPGEKEGRPRQKVFLKEMNEEFTGYSSMVGESVFTRTGTGEIDSIFGERIFEFPKPSELIRDFIEQSTDSDSIVLDMFAGSGTTAHAVLRQNNLDGGKRRFILVECEDYAEKLTAERVKRVIKGVKSGKDLELQKGLSGSFTYCELGPPFEVAHLLEGKNLPSYEALAQYVFHTATGKNFEAKAMKTKEHLVGNTDKQDVYLWYLPDVQKLKDMAFTLDDAEALGKLKVGRRRLVFAPMKYVDQEDLDRLAIDFVHLPYEIYERIP
jgi:adenine-specific DNA-methyltransferase